MIRGDNAFTLSLLLFLSFAGAQTPIPPDPSPSDADVTPVAPPFKFTASVGLVAALILIAVFLLAVYSAFTVHVSRTAESTRGGIRPRPAQGPRVGLDPEVVGTFPTLVYADVKGLRLGKGALECVVCLTEFEDDEVLRLIPKCDHVFHPECIDEWLGFHTTCPVCRADLVPRPGEAVVVVDVDPAPAPEMVQDEDEDRTIDREQGREPRVTFEDDKTPTRNPSRRSGSTRPRKFSRSHSTGHSLVQPGEDTERFTLRLPVDVRKQVMSRAVSMAAGASSSRRGYRGEGSSRGKSIRKPQLLDRPFRSERWGFTRLPSFLTRSSPVPSPRVLPSVSGEGGCIGRLPSFLTRSSPVPSPRVPPNNQGGSTGRSNQLGEGLVEPSQLPV